MSKNILYLSYDGMTDPLGQSQVLPYLKELSKEYNIFLHSFEKPKRLSLIENIYGDIEGFNICWSYSVYTKYPPLISKIIDLYKFNIRVNSIIKKRKISIIHCRGHYFTSLIGLKLKKKIDAKYIFDMRGFWADERIDGRIWNLKNPVQKWLFYYFKKKEKEFLKNADSIIVLTKSAKKEIKHWEIVDDSIITVIPCCTDENLFNTNNIQPIRKELNFNSSEFVISYVGSIGTWYLLDEMLKFFKELNKMLESTFLFITKDNPKDILKAAKSHEVPLNKIKVISSERKMMPSYIGMSNCSIFFILPCYSKIGSSPTKMGEIMNLGIPIVCNTGVGDVEEIMQSTMPELLVRNFEEQDYKIIIEKLIKMKFDKQKIIKKSNEIYSLKKGVKNYKDVYSKLTNSN